MEYMIGNVQKRQNFSRKEAGVCQRLWGEETVCGDEMEATNGYRVSFWGDKMFQN